MSWAQPLVKQVQRVSRDSMRSCEGTLAGHAESVAMGKSLGASSEHGPACPGMSATLRLAAPALLAVQRP
ncbi:hypothetical protein J1614_010843 [Plenodomus biglobosus]|nr:hypothetical protein J1614_010843 [Plenodomus biglobosus]